MYAEKYGFPKILILISSAVQIPQVPTYIQNGFPLALHLPLVFSASLMQFDARNVFLQKPHMHNTAAATKVIIHK